MLCACLQVYPGFEDWDRNKKPDDVQKLINGNGTDWYIVKTTSGWFIYDSEKALSDAEVRRLHACLSASHVVIKCMTLTRCIAGDDCDYCDDHGDGDC